MGWASYLEDNREKVSEAIDQLKWRIDSPDPAEWFRQQEAKNLIRVCEKFFFEFWRIIDLATDPELRLAWELKEARLRIDALGDRAATAEALLEDTRRELAEARADLARSHRSAQSWEDRFRALERDHTALISSDMGSALEHYSARKGRGALRRLRRKGKG